MSKDRPLILGEFRRSLDARYRLSIPGELMEMFPATVDQADLNRANLNRANLNRANLNRALLAKERPGALSLWPLEPWRDSLDQGIQLVEQKVRAGRLWERIAEIQRLGRLLSTRQREVPIAGRGRLVVPEGFREFLRVEAGGEVLLVGAAVCIEIWQPEAWLSHLETEIPRFRELFDDLSS